MQMRPCVVQAEVVQVPAIRQLADIPHANRLGRKQGNDSVYGGIKLMGKRGGRGLGLQSAGKK